MDEHDLFGFSREDTAEQAPTGEPLPVGIVDPPAPPPAWHPEAAMSGPRSRADGAWNFGKQGISSGLPRGRRPLALALVVVLVAGVGAYFFLSRGSSSGGTAFALSLSRDKTYSYDVHLGMQGTISVQGQQLPFNMQMDQTLSWRVESVDSGGTATVAVTAKTDSAVFNGQAAPVVPTQTTRIRVAKDGRILSAGFQITDYASNSDLGSLVPGSDQFMPLLPDHPVDVGDTWTKSFDQEMPFGMGRLRYDIESSLLRYEMVDRNRYAVIFSRFSLPLDMTIDLRKVLAASGNTAGQILPGGVNPKMKFGGTMNMQQTAWFDQAHGELDRTSADATFDMTIEFADFPQQAGAPTGAMKFSGTMNLQVQRLESTPKLSPKELEALKVAKQDKKAQQDLLEALAAAKTSFVDRDSYEKVSPRTLERVQPSLTYDTSLRARSGKISIRQATPYVVLLVTKSASGHVFCIGGDQSASGHDHYGTQDARRLSGCRGGW